MQSPTTKAASKAQSNHGTADSAVDEKSTANHGKPDERSSRRCSMRGHKSRSSSGLTGVSDCFNKSRSFCSGSFMIYTQVSKFLTQEANGPKQPRLDRRR